jgi:hypothetical protein
MLNLSKICDEYSFVQYCIKITANNLQLNDELKLQIDEKKLARLLNSATTKPIWFDYSEIAIDRIANLTQLDLLGHSNEPVIIVKPDTGSGTYLFKLRKYETSDDMFYGRDQKYLIEKCLILWLSNYVKLDGTENEDFDKYLQVCKNQQFKIGELNDVLIDLNLKSEKMYTALFNYFLKSETKVSLSDSTLNYLQSRDWDFAELETIAKEAFKIASKLSLSPTDIRIKRYFLPEPTHNNSFKINLSDKDTEISKSINDTIIEKQPELKLVSLPSLSKLEKTKILLDRYELAVIKLIEDKQPVLGKNIAKVCIPEISAPALTDSINKHRDRIAECLKKFPERWQNLRNNYLPIQKLNYLS